MKKNKVVYLVFCDWHNTNPDFVVFSTLAKAKDYVSKVIGADKDNCKSLAKDLVNTDIEVPQDEWYASHNEEDGIWQWAEGEPGGADNGDYITILKRKLW